MEIHIKHFGFRNCIHQCDKKNKKMEASSDFSNLMYLLKQLAEEEGKDVSWRMGGGGFNSEGLMGVQ